MCIKVDNRMECFKCGYPYSEARWPDELGIRCDATQEEYNNATAPHMKKWREINAELSVGSVDMACCNDEFRTCPDDETCCQSDDS
jgi:hypothetical protein